MTKTKVTQHRRVLKKLRGYKADEHAAHKDYAKFARSEELTLAEVHAIRAMSKDEARHEKNIRKIQRRLRK